MLITLKSCSLCLPFPLAETSEHFNSICWLQCSCRNNRSDCKYNLLLHNSLGTIEEESSSVELASFQVFV